MRSFIFSSAFCPWQGCLKEQFSFVVKYRKSKQDIFLFLTVIRVLFDVKCISALACREQNFCLIEKSRQEHKITLCLKLTTLSTTSGHSVLQKYRLMERTKGIGLDRCLFVWSVFEAGGPDENKH